MRKNMLKKEKILLILILSITGSLFIGSTANYKKVDTLESIHTSNLTPLSDPNDSVLNITNKFNYLQLEDDPNAEDAFIVAENTNDLLKGFKHYPIRTDRKKVVYLTFDDGPSITNTPSILKVLNEYNIKATFFVTGKALIATPESKELLKEIAMNGHAIGNHTYSHNYNFLYPGRTISTKNVITDLNKNLELMQSILGKDFYTRIIRLPGGYRTWNGKEAFKSEMDNLNLKNVDWNALNGDAEGNNKCAQELNAFLARSVNKLGDDADNIIILMHDTYGKAATVKALPSAIEYFKDKGFEFKTIK
ncbi:MAG: polysaccharide deacetylase family protein [Clostridium sp.]|uniref:polysaccharide deacetylase family protein n=1 Tax=Clostridium sp. TaxID=1506 RepID=UPI003F32762C